MDGRILGRMNERVSEWMNGWMVPGASLRLDDNRWVSGWLSLAFSEWS